MLVCFSLWEIILVHQSRTEVLFLRWIVFLTRPLVFCKTRGNAKKTLGIQIIQKALGQLILWWLSNIWTLLCALQRRVGVVPWGAWDQKGADLGCPHI